MVFYEVFSHPELRRYKATIFSKATIVQLVCIIITLLCPFLITYFAGGFWIKEKVATEHAEIKFQYRYIAFFETDSNFYLTSSYDNINQIYSDSYLPNVRTIVEIDSNDNLKNDWLEFDLFVSGIPKAEIVKTVKLLLFFNNTLTTFSDVNFESIAFLEASTSRSCSELSFSGELQLFQSQKFVEKATYNEFNIQYLDQNSADLEMLEISKILRTYFARPYGTRLLTDYVSWGNKNADGFNINAKVRYVPYKLVYTPAFWEQFKGGWIQYISVLIPFLYVFNLIKVFIFGNQLVPVIVMSNQKVKST